MFSADNITQVTRVHPHHKQTKEVLNCCELEGGRPMNYVTVWLENSIGMYRVLIVELVAVPDFFTNIKFSTPLKCGPFFTVYKTSTVLSVVPTGCLFSSKC
jgi:hypothetical protein